MLITGFPWFSDQVSCYLGSEAIASPKISNQPPGRSFMNSVMDTLLLKNTTFRTVKGKVPADTGVNNSQQVFWFFVLFASAQYASFHA